jgi:putative phosphotransacetylase
MGLCKRKNAAIAGLQRPNTDFNPLSGKQVKFCLALSCSHLVNSRDFMDENIINRIVDEVMARIVPAAPAHEQSHSSSPPVTDEIRAGRVIIGVSARHIHLTDSHVELLFGKGAHLTVFRPLHQPGEFASEQQLAVVGPGGKCLSQVRVLGPTRKASQVEVSLTDSFALGLKNPPPIRPSGNHKDTFGITLVGPKGSVTLESGLIRANRHIHMHTTQAAAIGLKDGDSVNVRVDGDRPTMFIGCQVRANDAFRAEMHLDTDDANAVGIRSGAIAQIILQK